MIISDNDAALAINAVGGAAFGTQLQLSNLCHNGNPDCTWTFSQGMIRSDTNSELVINAFGGAADGTAMKWHDGCTTSNKDCVVIANVAGPQCGGFWQAPCDGNVCNRGQLVNGKCNPLITRKIQCDRALDAGGVTASEWLVISSVGAWEHSGSAHNSGFWESDYTAGISVTASNGVQTGRAHNGSLGGTADFGSRDGSWDEHGTDPVLIDNWESFNPYSGRCALHQSTNGWLAGIDALSGLGIVVNGAVYLATHASNSVWQCNYGDGGSGTGNSCYPSSSSD
jgi:hypothetical protein